MKVDALGDLFLWLSSGITEVHEWSRSVGDSSVVILVRQELADLVRSFELFDMVLPIDVRKFRSNLLYRFGLLLKLRRMCFKHVLQLRIAREFLQEDAIVRAIDATQTLGVLGDGHNLEGWQAALSDQWYTPIVDFEGASFHELERNSAVAMALTGRRPVRFEVRRAENVPFEGIPSDYFVVAPGAGWVPRQWSSENFAELAKQIRKRWGIDCVVVGTGRDLQLSSAIADASEGISLCGKLSILQLVEIVRNAKLVVGNESGVVHVAAYLCVPSVAILGGGHFGWFMPYPRQYPGVSRPEVVMQHMACFGCNWQCVYPLSEGKAVPCIAGVQVDAVLQAVRQVMLRG